MHGGTPGGPIIHNKLSSSSYEGTRDQQTLNRTVSVPTAALRRGDLSASPTPIYDPFTGNANGSACIPFAGNIIPAERIDPTARQLLALLPLPNLATTGETNNYFVQAPFVLNRWTLDTKVNWSANEAEPVRAVQRARLLHGERDQLRQGAAGQPLGSSNPGTGSGNTYNVSAGATYMIRPTLLMDAHVGFVRMNSGVEQSDIGENKGLDFLHLPGTNGPNAMRAALRFSIWTRSDLGTTDTFMPYHRSDDQYQAVVNVNWIKGRHNVRFGTDIYYQALNPPSPEISGGDSFGARGGFRYQSGPTQIQGGPAAISTTLSPRSCSARRTGSAA